MVARKRSEETEKEYKRIAYEHAIFFVGWFMSVSVELPLIEQRSGKASIFICLSVSTFSLAFTIRNIYILTLKGSDDHQAKRRKEEKT
jgi:hypothetical protein